MKNNNTIIEEIELLGTLRALCTSYEEISVIKMQKIRGFVLATRRFYVKISDVYVNVKTSHKDQLAELMKKKRITDPRKLTGTVKNGKSIVVLLSANTKLHGPILQDVFEEFDKYVSGNSDDLMIVGKLGRELYEKTYSEKVNRRNYLYFEIPDMDISLEDVKSIVYHLLQYEHITVFFGQYESMMRQVPKSSNVTGDLGSENRKEEKHYAFLFEPSLEKILNFFETQIFSALFKQTVHESQLSRFASRIKAMEYALDRIDERKTKLDSKERRALKSYENKTQLERLSGISLWQK